MADQTHIEWTDATWNIVTGCSVVSPGCTNCYAMKLAGTRLQHHPSRAGLTASSKAGPVWTGEVRFNAQWLDQPLRWARPRMIFVAAHGDLFHDGVTDDQLDQIFAVMALCQQHTFQVLTKRPLRMQNYIGQMLRGERSIGNAALDITPGGSERARAAFRDDSIEIEDGAPIPYIPLPNVWLGVSAEDQIRADERIPALLATPAAVRWVSAEPLLGSIRFRGVSDDRQRQWDWLTGETGVMYRDGPDFDVGPRIDWVVAGGESGPGARPMHPDWARSLRDQCAAAGVPFLFKQWGAHLAVEWDYVDEFGWVYTVERGCDDRTGDAYGDFGRHKPVDSPTGSYINVGKKAAGRLLDGVLHDGFPEPRP